MTREILPTRRPSENVEFAHLGINYRASFHVSRDGRPLELFLSGAKPNDPVDIMASDAAIAASLALQFGCPAAVLVDALAKLPDCTPAGPLGRALSLVHAPVAKPKLAAVP